MADHINQPPPVSAEKILQTEIIVNQALIDILIAKQIISEKELADSIKNIRREQDQIRHGSGTIIALKK